MKQIINLLMLLVVLPLASQSMEKFSIDSGGASVTAGGIQMLYTIGEVNVQELSAGGISVSEGFINPVSFMINLDPKIFLEGPYNAGQMNDVLRSSDNIPTSSPYVDNATCNATVFDITGANAIIDWVWIELRDSNDGITVLAETSALLQADGDVVATDGTSVININVSPGNYYVMVSHRNHLGVLTANPINLSGSATVLDLTTDSLLVTGGANGIANMDDGNYALFAGDFDGNGQIQNSDAVGALPFIGLSGYLNADIDMNSQGQNTDILNTLNPNIGRGEQYSSRQLFAKRKTTTENDN
ncbi:hemagglutinin protein [Winogradskyella sp. F6397]|uniref:Hemagglutinin protein n=1 Tax=Winogradskyella marina TaxID=2785530 RepID=A0ABS0EK74_9FLAO|nr:hemagglutinin protein [Winogradskyella marina]MBF8150863.1 hemagglutinin protein [Winogradskyella marina]